MGHGHDQHDQENTVKVLPKDTAKIRKIWITTAILGIVTGIEFLFAFTLEGGTLKTSIFVLLTFVKTFYIVGEFMHLKYEVKTLIWCIIIPTMFIMWFIGSMLWEGGAIHELREWVSTWGSIVAK